MKEYVKIHETNGWENILQNEISTKTNNPHKNSLVTNANEVQQFDIIYENHAQTKIIDWKNETLKCSLLNQNYECIPYGHFFFINDKIKQWTKNYCRWYCVSKK